MVFISYSESKILSQQVHWCKWTQKASICGVALSLHNDTPLEAQMQCSDFVKQPSCLAAPSRAAGGSFYLQHLHILAVSFQQSIRWALQFVTTSTKERAKGK